MRSAAASQLRCCAGLAAVAVLGFAVPVVVSTVAQGESAAPSGCTGDFCTPMPPTDTSPPTCDCTIPPPPPPIDCSSPSVNDAKVAENKGPATFTISASGSDPQCAFKVKYKTADNTATAPEDYASTQGSVSLNGGETSKVDVSVVDDKLNEDNETFTLVLSGDGSGSGTGTIVDDDPPPTISVGSVTVAEGNGATAVFPVTLSAPSAKPITVGYGTVPGSATAGADFTPATGTLTFAPGETAKTVPVTIIGDSTPDGPETFGLQLSAPQNATLPAGQSTGQATITDQGPLTSPPIDGSPGPGGPGALAPNSPLPADTTGPTLGLSQPIENNGAVEWTVSCPGGEQVCIGSVRITAAQAKAARATKKSKRVLVGAKRYRLKGGEKKKIVVKINGRGVRLVRKRHRLPVKATFKTKDKAGNVSTRVQVFNLHESAFRHN